jgi:hypothetical protein
MARREYSSQSVKSATLARTAVFLLVMIILSSYVTFLLHETGHLLFALPFGCDSMNMEIVGFLSGYANCYRSAPTSPSVDAIMTSGGIITTAAVGFVAFWYYERTKNERKADFLVTMTVFVFASICLGSAFLNVALRALQPGGESDMARIIQTTGIDSRLFVALGFWMLSLLMWALWEELPCMIRKAVPGIGKKQMGKVYVALFIAGISIVIAYFLL